MWNLFGTYDFYVVKLDIGYGQVRGTVGNLQGAAAEMGASGTGLNNLYTPFTAGMRSDGLLYTHTNGYRQQAWTVGSMGTGRMKFDDSAANPKAKLRTVLFSIGLQHRF